MPHAEGETDFRQQVLLMLHNIQLGNEKRLTYLETHDSEMFGNGQPGWKAGIDKRLKSIETKVAMAVGGGTAIGILFHAAVDLWKK